MYKTPTDMADAGAPSSSRNQSHPSAPFLVHLLDVTDVLSGSKRKAEEVSVELTSSAILNDWGRYEESIRYYVRALVMNPKADNAWQYLRISLSIASQNDLLDACKTRNLEILQGLFLSLFFFKVYRLCWKTSAFILQGRLRGAHRGERCTLSS